MKRLLIFCACALALAPLARGASASAGAASPEIARLLNSRASGSFVTFAAAAEAVRVKAENGGVLERFVLALVAEDEDAPPAAKLDPATRWLYLDGSRERVREMAEQDDNALALYLLSVENNDRGYLKQAADRGNVQALNAWGSMVMAEEIAHGGGSTNRLNATMLKCFGMFRQAALAKDANGIFNVGSCHLNGWGCKLDRKLAIECFEEAARQGHPGAMNALSIACERGDGVPKDAYKALVWKLRARATLGDQSAAKWLKANGQ